MREESNPSPIVLIAAFLLCVSLAADVSVCLAKEAAKPNILFIAVDDLRPELGCYGVKEIHSPKIDALAATGLTFNRAYCQLAVCNPSRVSLMTGLRPDSSKVWDLVTRFRHTVPNIVTLPQQFKKHGYYAVSYGKIFHNPWPDHASWNEPHRWPEKSSLWSDEAKRRHAAYKNQMRAEGRPEKAINRIRPQATEIVDLPDNKHIDGAIAEQALAAMRRLAKQDQPFFLATGFVRPHLPFVVPRSYWELYDVDAITLAPNPFLPRQSPRFAMNTMYELRDYMDFVGTPTPDQGSLTEAQQRRLKHGYYASVSFIDALVGRLLEELESLGLADNTIVVLWGDHGWKLGEHNSWCKQTNYEIDTHIPLILRVPGAKANGQATEALVELIDIYPTLCELAGLPLPVHLEGKSMTPLLSKPDSTSKQAAFSQFRRQYGAVPLMGYSMRTDRYRYVEWQDRRTREVVATELYDHSIDTLENTDLAGKSENSELLTKLSRQMWDVLPLPPKFVPPKHQRPQAIFRNQSDVPLTLFWLPDDGEAQKKGVIQPGMQFVQYANFGHRFRVQGPKNFSQTFVVKRQRQTFDISAEESRPNILFLMGDDWSAPHASILGDPVVKTPTFDRIAQEGVLFTNAFVSAPSCTPSRLAIATGQYHWRLNEGKNLGGSLRADVPVYPEMLQATGYKIGFCRKGASPSKYTYTGRDPFGPRFKSFEAFYSQRQRNEPFCFWYGAGEPHRPYVWKDGVKRGLDPNDIKIPSGLPDNETTRIDLCDYYEKIQQFDRFAAEILALLEENGELEDTILVISGDNGLPFPRCKATLYDTGTHVPLAIRWGAKVPGGRTVEDFVSLCDLAPTLLEAAGLQSADKMTGKTLLPILISDKSGQVDPTRDHVLTGMEQHVFFYPSRAIRTADYLYIENVNPSRWKTGRSDGPLPTYDFTSRHWPSDAEAFSYNIDPSPTKQFMLQHPGDPTVRPVYSLSFGTRPKEELYDLKTDPDQLNNVANSAASTAIKQKLRERLESALKRTR